MNNVKYAKYPNDVLEEEDTVNHVVALYTCLQQCYPHFDCDYEFRELQALGFRGLGPQHMMYIVVEFLKADSLQVERARRSTLN